MVILVDDGIATGETMKAAIHWVKSNCEASKPCAIIVDVPVASQAMVKQLTKLVDAVVCDLIPKHLHAVGQFYRHFEPVSDEQVLELLHTDQQQTFVSVDT
jgi:predicted phosphoribosyltransferase